MIRAISILSHSVPGDLCCCCRVRVRSRGCVCERTLYEHSTILVASYHIASSVFRDRKNINFSWSFFFFNDISALAGGTVRMLYLFVIVGLVLT